MRLTLGIYKMRQVWERDGVEVEMYNFHVRLNTFSIKVCHPDSTRHFLAILEETFDLKNVL